MACPANEGGSRDRADASLTSADGDKPALKRLVVDEAPVTIWWGTSYTGLAFIAEKPAQSSHLP